MENLLEKFGEEGRLAIPNGEIKFEKIPWKPHAQFQGVQMKNIVTAKQTGGAFSFHLVKIAAGKKIGRHIHKAQLETHEVVAGEGTCVNGGTEIKYETGTISILSANVEHEVIAGDEGLCIFAKFIPALC